MTKKIVLASNNPGKIREIQEMLSDFGMEILPQSKFFDAEAEESGPTFIENAIVKARHAARMTGLPAISDDSGLEVDALGGAPGVYSARYAGAGASDEANNEKLLSELSGIEDELRTARFRCVMVYFRHAEDPSPIIAEGVWEGRILRETRGKNGFGYDPLFFLPDLNCSSAELSPADKNRLSHRGRALRTLATVMAKLRQSH